MRNKFGAVIRTVSSPTYVASSKPGANNKNVGNLVFVRTNENIGRADLHVMVGKDTNNKHIVKTAFYAISHHEEVLWRDTTPKKPAKSKKGKQK